VEIATDPLVWLIRRIEAAVTVEIHDIADGANLPGRLPSNLTSLSPSQPRDREDSPQTILGDAQIRNVPHMHRNTDRCLLVICQTEVPLHHIQRRLEVIGILARELPEMPAKSPS
jgi:hypothetical protein